ncbi:IS66 family insertion sequence element accessory protein TnpB [Muricoccus aerilatus]|uniref:IS66 family insertion sequence element accessory protein TnpB n=1 Tax=Muricoccus aerilatus TaxID=452982 RepID=UPI000A037E5D|nr:IS66 family insertion sequence element accessory protein TnpB [Roseomonas aerilata]
MIAPPAGARILLATKPVDFRKCAHSLAALAAEVRGADPFSGTVLVFRSRRAERIKILFSGYPRLMFGLDTRNSGLAAGVPISGFIREIGRMQPFCGPPLPHGPALQRT